MDKAAAICSPVGEHNSLGSIKTVLLACQSISMYMPRCLGFSQVCR